jgi:formylglycine-generating enzyme required for sulfatase activity
LSDIFISYKREERDKARQLADALEKQGWSIWWDPKLRAGEYFDDVIEQALDEAGCVIVLWSQSSVKSRYVRDESAYALDCNKLVPVEIEEVRLPFRFRAIHTPQLIDWDGSDEFHAFKSLVDDIAAKLGKPIKTKPKQAEPIAAKTDSQPATEVKPDKPVRTKSSQARAVGATAGDRPTAKVLQDTLKNGSKGPEMVLIEGGEFLMGSDPDVDSYAQVDEQPQHSVTIEPFYIGKYPVTFAEYAVFAQSTGWQQPDDQGWGRDRRPVINVSFEDAAAYCVWLSEQTGKRYSLPSEAEWEYAARAGARSRWYWGENEDNAGDYAWFETNANRPQPVGGKQPNDFGLYDMAGNVWEWVQDCWHGDYSNAPDDGRAWLEDNGGDCGGRVVRGGSWGSSAVDLRSAYRSWSFTVTRRNAQGFRVVCRPLTSTEH